jgi:hypothetical protein
MPRYYFHLVLGSVIIHDRHGAEFSDYDGARRHAIKDPEAQPGCATVVASTEGELSRVPFVEALGVLPVK